MLNHNYLYDTINNKKVITYYFYVSFVSAVFVDGHFKRYIDLKLSCYIKV